MKDQNKLESLKKFEIVNAKNILGGTDGPIIDKKKMRLRVRR